MPYWSSYVYPSIHGFAPAVSTVKEDGSALDVAVAQERELSKKHQERVPTLEVGILRLRSSAAICVGRKVGTVLRYR